MKKIKALQAALVACGLAVAGTAVAAGPSGEALSYTCAGCHGLNGQSNGPAIPTLAGMSKPVLVAAMEGFKSEEMPATIMGRIAKGYTDEQFEAMGDFFAKQKFVAANQSFDPAMAGKGMELHEKYCEKCHSDGGSAKAAVEEEVGMLAGQWKPYLHYTLNDFMSGARPGPKKMVKNLKKVHKKEGDAGIMALLDYYASQK